MFKEDKPDNTKVKNERDSFEKGVKKDTAISV